MTLITVVPRSLNVPSRYDEICNDFVLAQVAGMPVTLKELATKHGRGYVALRKAASDGRWSEKAAVARAERDAVIAEKITQRNAVMTALLEETIGREIEVRTRHALIARSMQRIALERLLAICPEDLSPTLAFQMLRAGIEEERTALGLADGGHNVCDSDADAGDQLSEAVKTAMAILEQHRPT